MMNFFSQNYPSYYRLSLSEKLASYLMQRRDVNIIGIPAIGKFTYMNFFIRINKNFIKDTTERNFIIVNIREFFGKNIDEFIAFFNSRLHADGENREVIYIIRFLDELNTDMFTLVSRYLLSLRQDPYNRRFIFISNRPLHEKTDNSVINSRLFGAEMYCPPSSMDDFIVELDLFQQQLDISIDREIKASLYDLTGGIVGFTKILLTYHKMYNLGWKNFNIDSIITENSDLYEELQNRCLEILSKFSPEEVILLKKIIQNEDISENKMITYLVKLGIIEAVESSYKIKSEILRLFLKS